MENLKRPFFIVAVAMMVLVVVVELGAGLAIGGRSATGTFQEAASSGAFAGQANATPTEPIEAPPGRGILYMALIDGIVLYTVVLMGISLVLPEGIHGRVQGIVTLVLAIILIIVAILLIIIALVELVIMVSLFVSFPFGTLAYLAIWGSFPRSDAAVLLGLIMFLKLLFAGFLLFAHPMFLQNKGLVLLVATSLVAGLLVTFLHGLVPRPLVSITDDIAAIVLGVIAITWALVLAIGSIPPIVRALRADRSASMFTPRPEQ